MYSSEFNTSNIHFFRALHIGCTPTALSRTLELQSAGCHIAADAPDASIAIASKRPFVYAINAIDIFPDATKEAASYI